MLEQVPLGEALGLGAIWQPAPVRYAVTKVGAHTPQGVTTLFVLTFDTAAGKVGFSFTAEKMAAFAKMMTEQSSGLSIASALDTNGHHI